MPSRPITRVTVTKSDGTSFNYIGWKAATKALGLGRARITSIAAAGGFLPNGDKLSLDRHIATINGLGRPVDNVKVRIDPKNIALVTERAAAIGIPARQLLTQIVGDAVATYLQRLQASPSAAA